MIAVCPSRRSRGIGLPAALLLVLCWPLAAAELTTAAKPDWNYEKAAHLLSRAGFGGTPAQIEYLVKLGRDGAVDLLVDFDKVKRNDVPYPAGDDLPPLAKAGAFLNLTAEQRMDVFNVFRRIDQGHMQGMREWWFRRMVSTNRPFEEKMTLFWHGHFTSGFSDVKNWRMLYDQNELLRTHCVGKFEPFLMAISTDSAMLEYLDNSSNQKSKPNENFARELMELFTMGVNTYTETDIKEAARALTGWRVTKSGGAGVFNSRQHDTSEKTFLGQKGDFELKDIIHIIMQRPETSRYLARKLWEFYAYKNPEPAAIEGLAQKLRDSDFDIRESVRAMLKCDAFYSQTALHAQIKSPVELIVGAYRQLEIPPNNAKTMTNFSQQMGQTLFDPPNVKGWDGGRMWINTSTLFIRNNFGTGLMSGYQSAAAKGMQFVREVDEEEEMQVDQNAMKNQLIDKVLRRKLPAEKFDAVKAIVEKLPSPTFYTSVQPPYDPTAALVKYKLTSAEQVIDHYIQRLNLVEVGGEQRQILLATLNAGKPYDPADPAAVAKIRAAVSLLMTLPAYQLN